MPELTEKIICQTEIKFNGSQVRVYFSVRDIYGTSCLKRIGRSEATVDEPSTDIYSKVLSASKEKNNFIDSSGIE